MGSRGKAPGLSHLRAGQPVRPGLLDRIADGRDRLLASPGFRRRASRFWLTRPLARRRVRALFDLCAGFVYSQVLLACVQTRLAEILREGPQSAQALAPRLGLGLPAAERLLAAAVSLRLVARRGGGRYGLGALGVALVDNPGLIAMIEHHGLLYEDLRDPAALLRGERPATALSGYWPYAERGRRSEGGNAGLQAAQVAAYTALMAASQPMIAAELLDAVRLDRYRCLLDVGGGDGSFLAAVAERAPHLRLMLFDLPAVAELASARFERAGLGARAHAHGGDFGGAALPSGADIVSLVRVLHDHDDDTALRLLRAVRVALPADGTLLLAEPMAQTAGAEPAGDAYFGFYLLAMGSGRPRSTAAITALLRQAGFSRSRQVRTATPLLARIVVAQP